ncbi:hypothetical protein DL768_008048 [Monosporascus sp. mg162]|nr:hypothetical protein DL768_008048 [Monosporascus sp. mg162]
MVDPYMQRVLLTDNLKTKVTVVCKESHGIAVHGSVSLKSMRVFRMTRVDSRRRLLGKGTKRILHFIEEAGPPRFSPEYDTSVYGVRYDPDKSALEKRYSQSAAQLIYGSALEYTAQTIPALQCIRNREPLSRCL